MSSVDPREGRNGGERGQHRGPAAARSGTFLRVTGGRCSRGGGGWGCLIAVLQRRRASRGRRAELGKVKVRE